MVGITAKNIWTLLFGKGSIQLISRKLKFPTRTEFFQDPSLTPRNPLSFLLVVWKKSEIEEEENNQNGLVALLSVSAFFFLTALSASFEPCRRDVLIHVSIVYGKSKGSCNSANNLTESHGCCNNIMV